MLSTAHPQKSIISDGEDFKECIVREAGVYTFGCMASADKMHGAYEAIMYLLGFSSMATGR